MGETTKYKIVESSTKTTLVTLVNEAIGQGWTPLGGVAVDSHVNLRGTVTTTYCQSMVKSKNPSPP